MLTSTAPAVAPKPIEEKKPEPPVADFVEATPAEAKPIETSPSFEPELESLDGLTIERLVTAPEVERREPVAASSVFGAHDERVYAFVEVRNESDDDKTLLVHFIGPEGQVSGGIELRIPAAHSALEDLGIHSKRDEAGALASRDPKRRRNAGRCAAIRGRARLLRPK